MILDAVIYLFAALAAVMGFRSGLLRSMATIIGYLIAAPFALGVAPALSVFLAQHFNISLAYNGVVLGAVLLVSGMLMGALLRRAVSDVVGPDVSGADRVAG